MSPPGKPSTSASVVPYAIGGLAALTGGASLALFLLFLLGWTGAGASSSGTSALLRDTVLSFAFFLQHSGMVRRRFRARLAGVVPPQYDGAAYAIASGLALFAVVLLWRRSGSVLFELDGPWRWAARASSFLAIAVFAWGVLALRSFDPFGLAAIRSHQRARSRRQPVHFAAAGPYRWVRHPLYSCILVLIWSCPMVTADRLLFDVLWTAWIWIGATLEEQDLQREFGETYRRYRAQVPMLVPWRGPVAVDLGGDVSRPQVR